MPLASCTWTPGGPRGGLEDLQLQTKTGPWKGIPKRGHTIAALYDKLYMILSKDAGDNPVGKIHQSQYT
ncbi:hypothetical protein Y1Q_0006522 [Alligator mississippiensis]|uniref:Uncharacterized protein n=1 Tax=Alligator mississippiensis TaxID=8496 RepID=A0A151M3S4_ALLMI|nr:hypothetical protein Y1Q_0006522 [Alligator mississippiensis]